jgi:hypothetical protein
VPPEYIAVIAVNMLCSWHDKAPLEISVGPETVDEGAAALAPNPVRGVLAANAIQKLEDDRDKATKSGAPT